MSRKDYPYADAEQYDVESANVYERVVAWKYRAESAERRVAELERDRLSIIAAGNAVVEEYKRLEAAAKLEIERWRRRAATRLDINPVSKLEIDGTMERLSAALKPSAQGEPE